MDEIQEAFHSVPASFPRQLFALLYVLIGRNEHRILLSWTPYYSTLDFQKSQKCPILAHLWDFSFLDQVHFSRKNTVRRFCTRRSFPASWRAPRCGEGYEIADRVVDRLFVVLTIFAPALAGLVAARLAVEHPCCCCFDHPPLRLDHRFGEELHGFPIPFGSLNCGRPALFGIGYALVVSFEPAKHCNNREGCKHDEEKCAHFPSRSPKGARATASSISRR